MRVVITGGHHTSALPVIETFKKNPTVEIFWFGHKYSIEGDKNPTLEFHEITSLGIPFYGIRAGKLYKTINPIRLLKIPLGFLQSLFLLTKIRPDVILSFGGYLAAPVVLAGWLLGIPSVTHEQTVVAGYANRFIAFFAKKVLVSWNESKEYFPKDKVVTVGLPLRKEIFEASSNNLSLTRGVPTIYITAGKTGSHVINQVVLKSLTQLLDMANIVHQCGDTSIFNDYETLLKRGKEISGRGRYNLRKFVRRDEIGEVFLKADLIVGRSGAHTIYELLALEKPAVLIPIPWVSHNEQFKNAALLYRSGLARILEEKDLSPKSLILTVKLALSNLKEMRLVDKNLKNSIVHNSTDLIVNEVFTAAKK